MCASTSCFISHDARIIPSSTERSCITIEHSYYKNNSDHLLNIYLCKDSVFSANGKISLGKMLFLGGFGAEKVKYY